MGRTDVKKLILLIIFQLLLLSCTVLPRSGPTKHDVYKSKYEIPIIPITSNVSRITDILYLPSWSSISSAQFVNYEVLNVDDKLDINIWENASEGLFTGNQKGPANLGPIVISGSGHIFIPYVGKVKAAGITIDQLQQKLTAILKNKVINPQIQIKKIEGAHKQISIQGVVSKPGTFELMPGRHDLIKLLAEAGGATVVPELTEVILQREGKEFKTTLADIFQSSQRNIALHPGDNLILNEINRSFSVLGATGTQKLIKFPKSELSLIEAVSLAEGLNDEKANPSSVFVLRYERNTILSQLLPCCKKRVIAERQPVIYVLNMKQMDSVFSAQVFKIRDGDLIITINAPYTNVRKIFSSLSPAVGIGSAF